MAESSLFLQKAQPAYRLDMYKCTLQMFAGIYRDFAGKSEFGDFKLISGSLNWLHIKNFTSIRPLSSKIRRFF